MNSTRRVPHEFHEILWTRGRQDKYFKVDESTKKTSTLWSLWSTYCGQDKKFKKLMKYFGQDEYSMDLMKYYGQDEYLMDLIFDEVFELSCRNYFK